MEPAVKTGRLCRYLVVALLGVFLWGCAYPISRAWRKEVNPAVTFSKAAEKPEVYWGEIVIWGGVVDSLHLRSGMMEMTIIQNPLDSRGRPDTRFTEGRFIAQTEDFINPERFPRGTRITLAAEIVGKREVLSGPMEIPFPVVKILQLHRWEEKLGEGLREKGEKFGTDFLPPFSSPMEESPYGGPEEP
jgi:outer membrane lipoprotein